MTRALSNDLATAIQQPVVQPVFLVDIEYGASPSHLFLSTLTRNISWAATTWLGNGLLRAAEGITEVNEVAARQASIILDGYNEALTAAILGGIRHKNKGHIYFGAFDSVGDLIINPVIVFTGTFDNSEFRDSVAGGQIALHYESDLIGLDRVNEFRYTDQSQQALFPGDRGFQYASTVPDWSGFWGKAPRVKRVRRRRTGRN